MTRGNTGALPLDCPRGAVRCAAAEGQPAAAVENGGSELRSLWGRRVLRWARLRVSPVARLKAAHAAPLAPQELQDVEAGRVFGATLDLKAVGQPLSPDTLVPGVAVYRCA